MLDHWIQRGFQHGSDSIPADRPDAEYGSLLRTRCPAHAVWRHGRRQRPFLAVCL